MNRVPILEKYEYMEKEKNIKVPPIVDSQRCGNSILF